MLWADSRISIENFYGIEIDDFAVEIAILSLWIAKHQMNREFREKFRVEIPLIPLKETGQIEAGNAARMDWGRVCPNDADNEIYLIGNPPYVGSSMQTSAQKSDFSYVFVNRAYSKKLNYIALWFIKGADYIAGTRAELAFVTTKTVSQGEHVDLMFPLILHMGVEIGFAHTGFQWDNNAKGNADVTVAVISLRSVRSGPKYLYTKDLQIAVTNINGYLADGDNIFVSARSRPLSPQLPPMLYGSKPNDGGNLTMELHEKNRLLTSAPDMSIYIRRFLGSEEFINGKDRFCVWVPPRGLDAASSFPELRGRFERTASMRLSSVKSSTQKLAETPHLFAEIRHKEAESILVPCVSSGLREYIPIGYLDPGVVISNRCFAAHDAEPWVFALLTSKMHMSWVNVVAGRMRINYQYSNTIVYNNFPVPPLPDPMKEKLTVAALRVLDVREYHCEQTLAELYDPEKMPQDLRDAHAAVDSLVDSIYSRKPYETDEQRLSDLFSLYERMTADEVAKAPAKKTRRTAT